MHEGCHDIKMTNVMIKLELGFVSARRWSWHKNYQCYDTNGISVCKRKKVILTQKAGQCYNTSGIRVCKAVMT